MQESPITLTPGCIRAILTGRKTQLRHVATGPSADPARDTLQESATGSGPALCALGEPGDRLWIREAWAEAPEGAGVLYQADDPGGGPMRQPAWQPARTMPRSASRLTLEIVRVRLEPVQAISSADLEAEGGMWRESAPPGESERDGFARWWSEVQARSGATWERNPTVWALEFRRVEATAGDARGEAACSGAS